MKSILKFQYLEYILMEDGKCNTEIRQRIGIMNDISQIKILRNRNLSLKTKKMLLNCYVISLLLHRIEYETISSEVGKRLETTGT